MIVPRSARLTFTITLTSKDANGTVFQNLGRAIIKKTTIRIAVMKSCLLTTVTFIIVILTCGSLPQCE